ncbi:Hypothetical_protein [Hexamita inflata]|uniref:Hypothetical_protein n=1 Tax=Hexamita inflata TaxID=28002 RepID=A0AA86UB09_9EUKA|nr:Hypothetical protein HINF_LOCUS36074 [Hexamita inflata]
MAGFIQKQRTTYKLLLYSSILDKESTFELGQQYKMKTEALRNSLNQQQEILSFPPRSQLYSSTIQFQQVDKQNTSELITQQTPTLYDTLHVPAHQLHMAYHLYFNISVGQSISGNQATLVQLPFNVELFSQEQKQKI